MIAQYEGFFKKTFREKRRLKKEMRNMKHRFQEEEEKHCLLEEEYHILAEDFNHLKKRYKLLSLENEKVVKCSSESQTTLADTINTTPNASISTNIALLLFMSNAVFAVVVYGYMHMVSNIVLNSTDQVSVIMSNVMVVQVVYMMMSWFVLIGVC